MTDPKFKTVSPPKSAIQPRKQESTAMFSLNEPIAPDRISLLPETANSQKLLNKLKEILATCKVRKDNFGNEVNQTGINLDMYPERLVSAWVFPLGDDRFFICKTRSTISLLYELGPGRSFESLYEDPRLMNVNLRRLAMLEKEGGRMLFLSRMTYADIDTMLSVASAPKEKKEYQMSAMGGVRARKPKESLSPVGKQHIPREELMSKLTRSTDIQNSSVSEFMAFANGIKFNVICNDENEIPCHDLISGEDEHSYRMYVNLTAGAPKGYSLFARFKFNNDDCVVYKEA